MSVGGSQQLRLFRRAIRDGATMHTACARSGLGITEARMWLADDAKNPPPPEAFELLQPEPSEDSAPAGASPEQGTHVTDTSGSNGLNAAMEMRSFIERWERLEEEKKGIASDQKDVMAEAKSRGYDTKALRDIIRLRKLTAEQRREREGILDTYKAALGMLDGTPLGRWAVDRLKPARPAPAPSEDGDDGDGGAPAQPAEPPATPEPAAPELTVADARRMGAEAAAAGVPITQNPFPAFDERRAAYDEAWCQALGSDGMDIPEALKPKPKTKAKKEDKAEKGDEA